MIQASPRRTRQWTFVELVAVLLVLSILGVVLIGRVQTIGGAELASEARIIATHLRFAQAKAMSDNTADWELRFSPGSSPSYSLYQDGTLSGLDLPEQGSPTRALAAGFSLTVTGGPTIDFDEWGSPGSTGHSVRVVYGGIAATVTVTPNTGYIP